jgi:hypothetical protein
MANTCTKDIKGVSATLSPKYTDEQITEQFSVQLDNATDDPVAVYEAALAANPTQFPARGAPWPVRPTYGLFAKQINPVMESDLGKRWKVAVTYMPLEPGEPDKSEFGDDPLLWPRTYRWDWVEFEEAIAEARNVDAIGSASGSGRAALTLGPVVNSALQEFDEGLFETVREGVLCIRYNVATLDEVSDIEDSFSRTTNSDTVRGRGPRRWKYIGVEDGDELIANGIKYRPIAIRVQLTKTTDRKLNNVGWNYWDVDDALVPKRVPFQVPETANSATMQPSSEPLFLRLDGSAADPDEAVTLTYRYLEEVPYAPLING